MQSTSFNEKRTHPRYPITIPLNYFEPTQEKNDHAATHDISQEGMCLVIDKNLFPGASLDIFIQMLDNGEKIYRKGRVVWSQIMQTGKYHGGIKLEEQELKPVPLILRTIMAQRHYKTLLN
jgi:hypothetical protein